MPILTAQAQVVSILADLPLPGSGGSTLQVAVIPPDPNTDQVNPYAFVWPSSGSVGRQSLPRPQQGVPRTGSTQAGWKQFEHSIDVWVTWFQDQGDPAPDMSFPVIMDAIMDALWCSTDPVQVQDPETFRWSTVYAIGERMTYYIDPPRDVADQRTKRLDGRVRVPFNEEFQA